MRNSECLLTSSRKIWLQFPCNACSRPPSRIWTWCLESCVYALHSHFTSCILRFGANSGSPVSICCILSQRTSLIMFMDSVIVKCPHLVGIQFVDLRITHRKWKNSQPEISKIYFRHVYSYFSSFKSWLLLLVFPSSFWGSFAGATRQNNTRPPFHVVCLAWLSQVAPAHVNHSRSSSNSDQIAWPAPSTFRQNHLQCFHNNRITTWIRSSPPPNHTKERKISSSKNQQREEQAFSKIVQPIDIQTSCTRRLRSCDITPRYHRQFLNTSCTSQCLLLGFLADYH